MYNLQLLLSLFKLLGTRGAAVLAHADIVIECLLKCVDLKNKTAAGYAARVRACHMYTKSSSIDH